MQLLVKLIMNSLYGEFLRKDILESYQCKFEMWIQTEYDERVLDYQKIVHGKYIVKMKDDEGLEDEVKRANTLPLQVALLILSNSKRIMNNLYTLLMDLSQMMFIKQIRVLYISKVSIGIN